MVEFSDDEARRILGELKPKTTMQVTNLASITPTKQPFLWWPYLPLGRVVIVAGAPGHGKSQLSALIAGMTTRGTLYPGDVQEPSRVLMLCAEDDLPMTVVPRLLAVNADLKMVDTIDVVTKYPSGLTAKGLIKLPTDAETIHEWVKAHADARLIVLDPVASFFDRSHSMLVNQDTRDALGPLVAIAESYGVTIVIILHLNKSESKDFANRIAESHGFQALARSVIALAPDPDDPERERGSKKVLALTKANLVKPGGYAMRCEVRSVTLPGTTPPIETSELALVGKCDISADDLLISASERSGRLEARVWLDEFLDGGWQQSDHVKKAAISDGFGWRAIERVREAGEYKKAKQPGVAHGPWWIGAPDATPMPVSGGLVGLDQGPTQNGVAGVGGVGGLEDIEVQGRQDRPSPAPRARPREAGSGGLDGLDLDAYRDFERRKLGEDDDDGDI